MQILIDADACPVAIMGIIQKAAEERDLDALFVTSVAHVRGEDRGEGYQFLIVDQLPEAVDLVIANRLQEGDLVITQDYGLAALALGRQAMAISPAGLIFSDDNIGSLLTWRHLSAVERRKGFKVRGNIKDLLHEDIFRFSEALERVLAK